MRGRIIKIVNSQGIRIPKAILKQTGISEDVEVLVEKNQIIICPIAGPRNNWDNAFKKMAEKDDDLLLDGDEAISHSWDDKEWHW
jgi:antitoxin MazE